MFKRWDRSTGFIIIVKNTTSIPLVFIARLVKEPWWNRTCLYGKLKLSNPERILIDTSSNKPTDERTLFTSDIRVNKQCLLSNRINYLIRPFSKMIRRHALGGESSGKQCRSLCWKRVSRKGMLWLVNSEGNAYFHAPSLENL